ncbi:MAG: SDR family oxidoreductase, partial [Asticcacaulis sp.]|nr:SDR family oxidoreductase [Asticcacaulis sp.]
MADRIVLQGKRILVSGGTTGIGRETVRLLAERGARVLTFGRDEEALKTALAYAQGVIGLAADAATRDGIQRVFAELDDKLGGIDI